MKKFLILLLTLVLILLVIISINTLRFNSKQISSGGDQLKLAIDQKAVEHLSEAIRFKTISYDDKTITPDDSVFGSFINYLQNIYPNSFKNLEVTVINKNSLLLLWKGKNPASKPAILYAHMDVVPADTSGEWHHPPYSGAVDEKFIYGRGTIDDKGSVIAILESIEKLISKGIAPSRDIYIAFGSDEEAGGEQGAKMIAEHLLKNGVKAEFLLDEGGMIAIDMVPFVKQPVALVFTSEKGYMTLELSVKSHSGHSSFPPSDPPIEILSKAIREIHDHPFEKRMTESVNDFMDYTGPEMRMPFKSLFANRWLFGSVIFNEYEKIPSASAMIRTTSVATVINGGTKENVIPSEVSAKINFRLLPGDESKEVIEKVKKIINDERVSIKVIGNIEEPSTVSSTSSESFGILRNSIHSVFPDAVIAPSLMIAQTDSRHFRKVTENIYRFVPIRMNDEILSTMHGADEKIGIGEFMEAIEFYEVLLKSL